MNDPNPSGDLEGQAAPTLIGRVLKDTYEITGHLSAGGYGVLYKGQHIHLKTPVAVKVQIQGEGEDDRQRKRFFQEAQAAAQLRHPNIVAIQDFDVLETGEPYMVMDLLEGHDLGVELHRYGALGLERALNLLIPCLDGLAQAHDLGIVHKDLKPANLFVVHPRGEDEHLCVLDFGIARMIKPRTESAHKLPLFKAALEGIPESLTVAGKPVGTARYIAPEYLRDQDNVTPAVDVYQIGLILVEMITGSAVVQGEGWVALAMKHVEGDLDVPDAILDDPRLGPIVRKALSRDPEGRFADARVFKEALEGLRAGTMPILQAVAAPRRGTALPLEEQATRMFGVEALPPAAEPTVAMSLPEPPALALAPRDNQAHIAMISVAAIITAIVIVGIGVYVVKSENAKVAPVDPPPAKAPVEVSQEGVAEAPACPPGQRAVEGACAPKGSEGMVVVPAGVFLMGCNEKLDTGCQSDEKPGHEVTLAAFEIDTLEVSVGQYEACLKDGGCSAPREDGQMCQRYSNWGQRAERADHPINCVTYAQAEAFCEWAGGKRLPTEAEWQKAARGGSGRIYPWGNQPPSCDLACVNLPDKGPGCGLSSTCPVGSRAPGASPYGALDMAGNVAEFTSDWYSADAYAKAQTDNPKGPAEGKTRAVHGGSFANNQLGLLRLSHRFEFDPAFSHGFVGFRCVRSLASP